MERLAPERRESSFSQQVKKELVTRRAVLPQHRAAALLGFAAFAKQFTQSALSFVTEQPYIAKYLSDLLAASGIGYAETQLPAGSVRIEASEPVEMEKLYALIQLGAGEASLRIVQSPLLQRDKDISYFLAAAFLSAGTVSDPQKGYTASFVTPRFNLSQDISVLLRSLAFTPRTTQRGNLQVVYLRASEEIEDLLTFMGAGRSSLSLMEEKVVKDLRNRANRLTNCETANIEKSIAATERHLAVINSLVEAGALDALPEVLRYTARLRLENPEASLAEIGQMFSPPLSKAGVSHRLRKIEQFAQSRLAAQKRSTHAN